MTGTDSAASEEKSGAGLLYLFTYSSLRQKEAHHAF